MVSSNHPLGLYSLLQLGTFLAHWMFEAQDPIHHSGEFRDAVVGHDLLPLQQRPHAGMDAYHERNYSSDGAHRNATTRGRKLQWPDPVP